LQTDVTVVIRESNERTRDVCYKLIAQQVPEQHIVMIREVPFSRAVQRTFEIGLEQGQSWTLAVDADMLLLPDAVKTLVQLMEKQASDVFVLRGTLLDKLLVQVRIGGPHLFRTSLCEQALGFCQNFDNQIRPETFITEKMHAAGYRSHFESYCASLHDFEQSYTDIFRKCVVHAHKHRDVLGHLEDIWRRMAQHDSDYQIAMLASVIGGSFYDDVQIDTRQFPDQISELLEFVGLKEKMPLSQLTFEDVMKQKEAFQAHPAYIDSQKLFTERQAISNNNLRELYNVGRQHYGTLGSLRWLSSLVFKRLSRLLAP